MPIGTYTPPLTKSLHKFFFYIFFYFRCILLQISHKKCFFISISILGRSWVKNNNYYLNKTSNLDCKSEGEVQQ